MVTPESLCNGSESGEQRALFCWAARAAQDMLPLRSMFAIPNGDQRGDGTTKGAMIAGARLKAEGLRDGVPDILLAWPKACIVAGDAFSDKHGLFIEMKRPALKNAKNPNAGCKPEQLDWHARLRQTGYCVVVCYSWQDARDAILEYLA